MRAALVKHFAAGLLAAMLLGAVGFEWLVRPTAAEQAAFETGPDSSGQASFGVHCGSCHTLEALRQVTPRLSARDYEAMLRFLEDHGDASPAEDRLVVDFIWSR